MTGHRLGRRFAAATVVGAAALLAGCGGKVGAPKATTRSSVTGSPLSSAHHSAVATRYLVIAKAGNERLEDDFDPLQKRDRNRLAAAEADLRDAAATERLFDRRLLRISFPARTERVARRLYRVNQARATLTVTAAASKSLRRLHAYERRLNAANVPVETAVKTIRRQLGLPPPSTS